MAPLSSRDHPCSDITVERGLSVVNGKQSLKRRGLGLQFCISQPRDLWASVILNCKMRGLDQKASKVSSSFDFVSFNIEYHFVGLCGHSGTGTLPACRRRFEHQWPLSESVSCRGLTNAQERPGLTVVTFFFWAALLSLGS